MTLKENMLQLLKFQNPDHIPYGLEAVRTFWHRDARFFFGNGVPGAVAWTDAWGVDWKLGDVNATESFHPVTFPLESLDDIDRFAFPDPLDPGLFADIQQDIEAVDRDEYLLMLSNPGCLFNRAWLLRGMENFLVDMLLEPEMSEVLLDFAKPLLDGIDQLDRRALNASIKMAVTVWNYSIIISRNCPTDSFAERLNKKSMTAMVKRAFRGEIGESVLTALLERKDSLYPDINRFIADFNIEWEDAQDTYHLTVMSPD